MKARIALAVFLIVSFSFVTEAFSRGYLVSRPVVFRSPAPAEVDPQEFYFNVMILALEGKGWQIEGIDREEGLIRATACRRNYCMTVDVLVDDLGITKVLRTPRQRIGRGGQKMLKGWMRHLKKSYKSFRRYSPERLRAKVDDSAYPPFPPEPEANPILWGRR